MNGAVAWHVLAGFRCVDAITSNSVLDPLRVTAQQLQLRRNRSGVFAVMSTPNLVVDALIPSSWPAAPTAYEIAIEDPTLRYLPRRASIQVPQPLPPTVMPGTTTSTTTTSTSTTVSPTTSPTTTVAGPTTTPGATPTTTAAGTSPLPTTAAQGRSPLPPLTVPQQVVLYPSPGAPVAPNWAVVRVYVVNNAIPPQPLFGAVVQAAISAQSILTGVTNRNGEALLAAHGLGVTFNASNTGAVIETATAATVTGWFDPTIPTPPGWIPNPDDILQNLPSPRFKSASQTVMLEPKRTTFVNLTISM
jgi:hypothetical protein